MTLQKKICIVGCGAIARVHAVGTLRSADSPEKGVLNPDGRVWNVDNLFIVDGSFMPTSGGVNPSLTIAANALRIAERMALTH